MKPLKQLDDGIFSLEKIIIVCALIVMAVVVFVQVLLRFFDMGIPWAEELARYLLVWTGFMGASIATRQRRHLKVDVLPRLLDNKPDIKAYVVRLASLISAGFCFFLVWLSYDFIANTVRSGRMSNSMKFLPIWVIQLSIPVTLFIMACRFLGQTFGELVEESEIANIIEES